MFALDAERAHRATIEALKFATLPPRLFAASLRTRVAGIDFPSTVGLAAGFDKDAEGREAMLWLGFGFVEVGTVTRDRTWAIQSRACSGWQKTKR